MPVAGHVAQLEEIKAKLEAEWEGRLEAEGLPSELEELPATAAGAAPQDEDLDGPLGTAAVAKVVADAAAVQELEALSEPGVSEEDDGDDGAVSRPAAEPASEAPTLADLAVVDRVRAMGYAATLAEAGDPTPEQVGRLADAGMAFYRAAGGDAVVLAMAGATEGDVRRAGNRAEAEAVGAGFEADVRAAGRLAERIAARVARLGKACAERELVGSTLGSPGADGAAVRAVLGALAEEGLLRRISVGGVAYVGLASATREQAVGAIRASARAMRPNPRKGAVFAKPVSAGAPEHGPTKPAMGEVAEVGGVRVEDAVRDFAASLPGGLVAEAVMGSRKAQGAIRAAAAHRLPVYCTWSEAAMVEPEVAEWRAGHAKRRAENARIARRGPDAAAKRLAAEGRSRPEGRLAGPPTETEAERAAWKTAAAIHLRGRKTCADKLLLLARLEGGPIPARELLGRLKRSHRPELLRDSLRRLAAEGKVGVFKEGGEGEPIVEATEPLDRRSYRRALLRIIADPENGIPLTDSLRNQARIAAHVQGKMRWDDEEEYGGAGRREGAAPVAA